MYTSKSTVYPFLLLFKEITLIEYVGVFHTCHLKKSLISLVKLVTYNPYILESQFNAFGIYSYSFAEYLEKTAKGSPEIGQKNTFMDPTVIPPTSNIGFFMISLSWWWPFCSLNHPQRRKVLFRNFLTFLCSFDWNIWNLYEYVGFCRFFLCLNL